MSDDLMREADFLGRAMAHAFTEQKEKIGTILGMEMWEDPKGPSLTVRNHTKKDVLIRDLGWVIPAKGETVFEGADYDHAKRSLDLKMFEQHVHGGFPSLPKPATTECVYCGTIYKEVGDRTNCKNCGAPLRKGME